MSEFYLWLLSAAICVFALWRMNWAALCFGALIFGHDFFLGHLAESDPMAWMVTGGISSTLSMAGCYYFRKGLHDTIAFWMAGLSALCLLVNIICIIVWLQGYSMGGFNYVFAGILLAGIFVILKGDRGGLGTSERDRLGNHVYRLTDKMSNRVVGLENRETSK